MAKLLKKVISIKINILDYTSVDDALDALYMGAKMEKEEEDE